MVPYNISGCASSTSAPPGIIWKQHCYSSEPQPICVIMKLGCVTSTAVPAIGLNLSKLCFKFNVPELVDVVVKGRNVALELMWQTGLGALHFPGIGDALNFECALVREAGC